MVLFSKYTNIINCVLISIMAYVQSEKRRQRFVDGNYIVWADGSSKVNPRLLFWRCVRKPVCEARLHTINSQLGQRMNEHSHVGDRRNAQTARIVEGVREEASRSRENSETLIVNATVGLEDEIRGGGGGGGGVMYLI